MALNGMPLYGLTAQGSLRSSVKNRARQLQVLKTFGQLRAASREAVSPTLTRLEPSHTVLE
jgi:hypothetical protein